MCIRDRDMVVLKEKPAFREPDQELFDHLDRTYVDAVKKEPIRGTALVTEGKPVQLTVEYTPSLEPTETMEDGMAVLEPVSYTHLPNSSSRAPRGQRSPPPTLWSHRSPGSPSGKTPWPVPPGRDVYKRQGMNLVAPPMVRNTWVI